MECCIKCVKKWMNDNKTEVLLSGSAGSLRKLERSSIHIRDSEINYSSKVKTRHPLDLDVFQQLPELQQSQIGEFSCKRPVKYWSWLRESVAGCEGRLSAYHQAWFPPNLRFVSASTKCRLSGNYCRNIGKNVKINWNDGGSQAQCAMCNHVRTFALLSELIVVFLKRKIHLYILRTSTKKTNESVLLFNKWILQFGLCSVTRAFGKKNGPCLSLNIRKRQIFSTWNNHICSLLPCTNLC